jgi:hypothetical protein
MRIEANDVNVDALFEGVMIPVDDGFDRYWLPGWKCRMCGWRVGSRDLPPWHDCPSDGQKQAARRVEARGA